MVWAAGKLNRYRRSDHTRKMRGSWLVFFTIIISVLVGQGLTQLFYITGVGAEIVLLAVWLLARSQIDWTLEIERMLRHTSGKVDSSILPVKLVRRQQKEYDTATVLRGSIEVLMVSLSEAVIAPLFYYIIAGWQGVLLVSFMAVLDAHIGYRNSQYESFGAIAAKAHSFLQWIPARITGVLLCMAAFFAPMASGVKAWKIMLIHAGHVQSRNAGWPIAATAGALGITLGGPRAMYGSFIADQWIGEGKTKIDERGIRAARWLFVISLLIVVMAMLLAASVM